MFSRCRDRDHVLEAAQDAERHDQGDHHRQTREDRARDEIGGEDRRVPSGHDRGGEVEADDRVHAHDQRGRQAGQHAGRPSRSCASAAPSPASPGRASRRSSARNRPIARSRRVAKSGIKPKYQNMRRDQSRRSRRPRSPTTARCGSWDRSGWRSGAEPGTRTTQTRPRWIITNSPAQATANSVMASANRFRLDRHFWRNRNRMAEIKVPAWPMPTQKTKLVMSKRPAHWLSSCPRCRCPVEMT